MAKIPEMEINMKAFDEWVAERPASVQALIRRFPPDHLYRLKSSGHRCTIYSYAEDDTLKVNVTGQFNFVIFDRQVFGIKPDDLEECELPTEDEILGTALEDQADIDAFVELARPSVLAARGKTN